MVVALTSDHARLLERKGWDKDRIREHIHARTHHETPLVRNRGLVPVRPKGFDKRHPMPVTRSPEDAEVVVAGGRGGHSAVILPSEPVEKLHSALSPALATDDCVKLTR